MVTRRHLVNRKITDCKFYLPRLPEVTIVGSMTKSSPILTDREVLEKIGDEALIASNVRPHCVKAWKYRGIPWKDRAKVARIAASKRIKLPLDFGEERRVA